MFSKDTLAIDIGSSYIKILLGNKQKVKLSGIIKTPEKSVVDDNILDVAAVKDAISSFINENSLKASEVSYAIHGQDIVIRHIEVPIMDDKGIRNSVEWEICQYLPENGINYYTDYEILDKVNTKDKKAYNILVVAAPKGKIDKYIELSKYLGYKLKAVDIGANCISRVFRQMAVGEENSSIGVVDLGHRSSNIIILDKGKLFIEREVAFGIRNAIIEITRKLGIDDEAAYAYLFQKYDFNHISQDNEIEKAVQALFDNALSSFENVIQFYTTGKTKKNLDKIFLIGGGCNIPGISNYIMDYYGSPTYIADSTSKVALKTKLPVGFDFKVYVNALGLILRKE